MFSLRKKEKTVQTKTEELDLYPILHIANSMKSYQKKLVVNEVASLNELQKIQTAFDLVLEENQKLDENLSAFHEVFSNVNEVLNRAQIHFENGEFEFAIDSVSEVLQEVYPNYYEDIMKKKGYKDE